MHKFKIVMVDDEPLVLQMGKLMLSSLGCELNVFERGDDAIQFLNDNPDVSLVILDLMMHTMPGLDVLRELKCNAKTKDIPVIIQTGVSADKELNIAYKLGALSCIHKPYSKEKLRDKIMQYLKQ